jgi:hypothetical protein
MTGGLYDSIRNGRRLARYLGRVIIPLYDVGVHLAELPRILKLKPKDYSETVRELQTRGARRLALVAPHPTQPLQFTLDNLVEGLIANNYSVVLLVCDANRFSWLLEKFPGIILVNRRREGRDFGAWKEFILSIIQNEKFNNSLERLILVNDSLYYTCHCSSIFKELTETDSSWACLFENYEHHYHAQSFLLSFGQEALRSRAFAQFWTKYKPYSSRKHSIDKGEVLLSRRMSKALGAPHCITKAVRLVEPVGRLDEDELRLLIRAIRKNNFLEPAVAERLSELLQLMGDRPFPVGRFYKPDERRLEVARNDCSRVMAFLALERNPTHTLGLAANFLLGLPVKRDICVRAGYYVHDVMNAIRGFSLQELQFMEEDLRHKQVQRPRRGIGRLLFEAGRI